MDPEESYGLLELPKTQFGVKCFQITEEQYLNPAGLFEKLSRDLDIQRTGVFIGRLSDSEDRQRTDVASVETVKHLLQADPTDRETKQKIFSPEVLTIGHMWEERNVFNITGNTANQKRTKQYQTLKEKFRNEIMACPFFESPTTELEHALESDGIHGALDSLIGMLRDKEKKILYAPTICSDTYLQTSSTCSMKDMQTNLEDLAGGPHLGITLPSFYVGSEASTFSMHIEDHAFESVNRHVAGKDKVWFLVPPRYSRALYDLIRDMGVSKSDRTCAVFLQHRHVFIDPRTLLKEGIPVTTVIQKPGDVVYVLPNCHYEGFNLGPNINEAINCASKAFALSGMLSSERCHCPIVSGLHYVFELEGLFLKLGVDVELVRHYNEDRLRILSDTLHRTSSDIHPQSGRPFDRELVPARLLGPQFEDMEISKPWLVNLGQHSTPRGDFWGGCDMIDLIDDDDEEEKMGVSDTQHEGGKAEELNQDAKDGDDDDDDEDDEDDDDKDKVLQKGKSLGPIQCRAISCSWSTGDKGKKGMSRLQSHVKKNHTGIADTLWPSLQRKYDMELRQYKSTREFDCSLCGKTRRGTAAHEKRHLKTCKGKNVNTKY